MKKFLIGISMLSMLGSIEVSASMQAAPASMASELPHPVPQAEAAAPALTPNQQADTEEFREYLEEELSTDTQGYLSLDYIYDRIPILGEFEIGILIDFLKSHGITTLSIRGIILVTKTLKPLLRF